MPFGHCPFFSAEGFAPFFSPPSIWVVLLHCLPFDFFIPPLTTFAGDAASAAILSGYGPLALTFPPNDNAVPFSN